MRLDLVFVGIAPHPPIMVPEVGGDATQDVRSSIRAMQDLTERIIGCGAETVLLISPHAPLDARAFVAYSDQQLRLDFENFRAPGVRLEFDLDQQLLETIERVSSEKGFTIQHIYDSKLDHGTAVPLYFLDKYGWRGRVVALGYSYLANDDHLEFGACIARSLEETGKPTAVIASGDLSHRLKPGAPAGYYAGAEMFDKEVVDAIAGGEPQRIIDIDQDLRKLAGECGYRSMLVAFGAARDRELACEVLAYEAPFGVGYLVAQILNAKTSRRTESRGTSNATSGELATSETPGAAIIRVVREAVENYLCDGSTHAPEIQNQPDLKERAACFVSIRTRGGELRGCMGTVEPAKETLAEELAANAIRSATWDPRFEAVTCEELSNLTFSVDVLSPPEPAAFDDLDPKIYGVIVQDESGKVRGVLLPDLDGVKTPRQQVSIAASKAGLNPDAPLTLFRFRVQRFREKNLED